MHLTCVALHEVTWCMVVWCTQNAPKWQQFPNVSTPLRWIWWWSCRASCSRMSVDILGKNCDQCRRMVQCCFASTETVRLIRTEITGRPSRLSHSGQMNSDFVFISTPCLPYFITFYLSFYTRWFCFYIDSLSALFFISFFFYYFLSIFLHSTILFLYRLLVCIILYFLLLLLSIYLFTSDEDCLSKALVFNCSLCVVV